MPANGKEIVQRMDRRVRREQPGEVNVVLRGRHQLDDGRGSDSQGEGFHPEMDGLNWILSRRSSRFSRPSPKVITSSRAATC